MACKSEVAPNHSKPELFKLFNQSHFDVPLVYYNNEKKTLHKDLKIDSVDQKLSEQIPYKTTTPPKPTNFIVTHSTRKPST